MFTFDRPWPDWGVLQFRLISRECGSSFITVHAASACSLCGLSWSVKCNTDHSTVQPPTKKVNLCEQKVLSTRVQKKGVLDWWWTCFGSFESKILSISVRKLWYICVCCAKVASLEESWCCESFWATNAEEGQIGTFYRTQLAVCKIVSAMAACFILHCFMVSYLRRPRRVVRANTNTKQASVSASIETPSRLHFHTLRFRWVRWLP